MLENGYATTKNVESVVGMSNFYIRKGEGKVYGPYDGGNLKSFATSGKLPFRISKSKNGPWRLVDSMGSLLSAMSTETTSAEKRDSNNFGDGGDSVDKPAPLVPSIEQPKSLPKVQAKQESSVANIALVFTCPYCGVEQPIGDRKRDKVLEYMREGRSSKCTACQKQVKLSPEHFIQREKRSKVDQPQGATPQLPQPVHVQQGPVHSSVYCIACQCNKLHIDGRCSDCGRTTGEAMSDAQNGCIGCLILFVIAFIISLIMQGCK